MKSPSREEDLIIGPGKAPSGAFPIFVIDTREQKPFHFSSWIPTERIKLEAGDYSVKGLEDLVTIERKSLEDLVSTIMGSRPRFARELKKLRSYSFAAIVVEASIRDIWKKSRVAMSMASPRQIQAAVDGITVKGQIPVFLEGDRAQARMRVEGLLLKSWEKYHGKSKSQAESG